MGDIGLHVESDTPSVEFHIWPQHLAQTVLITLLKSALPHCVPLYNRILAPHNTPDQHCLFAASFPPNTPSSSTPEIFTVIFSDRSRNHEAQIWLYSSLVSRATPTTREQKDLVAQHVTSAFQFINRTPIPDAPGWPFSPLVRFDRTQTEVADALVALASPHHALQWDTNWNRYNIPLSGLPAVPTLPDGLEYRSPVPEDQLDLVISTSAIPRQKETLRCLPSSCILDKSGHAVAWAFCGMDASLATLFVVEAWRKKGLAKAVAADLLHKIRDEYEFSNLKEKYDAGIWTKQTEQDKKPFGKGAGYVFAEIKIGNTPSEKTMEWLGGSIWAFSRYTMIDASKIPTSATIV